jgi:hypothetical protein
LALDGFRFFGLRIGQSAIRTLSDKSTFQRDGDVEAFLSPGGNLINLELTNRRQLRRCRP